MKKKKDFHEILFNNLIQSLENGEWKKYYSRYIHSSKASRYIHSSNAELTTHIFTFIPSEGWVFSTDDNYNAEKVSFNYRESRKISKAIEQNNSRRSLRVLIGDDPVEDDEILEAQSNLRKWTTP